MMRLSNSDLEATVLLSRNLTDSGDNPRSRSSKLDTDAIASDDGLAPLDSVMAIPANQDANKPVLADDAPGADVAAVARSQSTVDSSAAKPDVALPGATARDGSAHPYQNGNGHTTSIDGPKPVHSELGATPDVEAERGFLPVLRNRNFLTLWSGQVFSQLADKVYLVLMIALIASRFQNGDQSISGWVSSIMIAFTIPAVLFGSVAGVFVDRWPKKTVLVLTNLLRGGLVFTLPPLLWLSKGWSPLASLPVGFCILLGITFLVSTLTQFFAPAEQSALPLVVD